MDGRIVNCDANNCFEYWTEENQKKYSKDNFWGFFSLKIIAAVFFSGYYFIEVLGKIIDESLFD